MSVLLPSPVALVKQMVAVVHRLERDTGSGDKLYSSRLGQASFTVAASSKWG